MRRYLILIMLAFSGCTTIDTVSDEKVKNKILSGTARHIELQCAHAVCIDAPFSLVLDVVLLPATIPLTFYKNSHISNKQTSL